MTDAPAPPRRHRRLIIVAVVILVLVSLVAWWYWPRGDARFVGKWEFQYMGAVGGGIPFELELKPNGVAVRRTPGAIGPTYARWTVGAYLLVGTQGEPVESKLDSLRTFNAAVLRH